MKNKGAKIMIRNIEQKQADVENVLEAIEHIKKGSYITGYAVLNNVKRYCSSNALPELINEIRDELMQVAESNTFVFDKYCKGEIKRVLNQTDKKITSGYDLGMYISENVCIPEDKDQQEQLKKAWAEELLDYWIYAYGEGILTNPFYDPETFLKKAVGQAAKIMIQLSDTCEANWNSEGPKNLLDEKQTIIEEIIAIKSIRFEEIF
ncbi:hypothetical protein M3573_18770 [Bacillus safensis]|uniref:hypothetical protein n=1 Tax=Bacillus safensis TaxID=561879 RepID=UPI00204133FD|nr:hypothetical protein [Bacillus safensis]MCM3140321.1 hypothetical protein [Bacillus safensis]